MSDDNVTPIKKAAPSVADEVRAKIIAAAEKATAEEKAQVADIVAQAKKGKFATAVYLIRPAVAAILFLEHNPHNRDWRADGPRSCLEYARRMETGQWRRNNATIGFYVDGQLEDGQHRLSGAAVGGYTMEVAVIFGIERDAIVTVDDGLNRHAADAAKLDGIENAKAKQTIVKLHAAYLAKAGDKSAALRSEAETAASIKANNELLDEAIEIGNGSLKNVVDPVLKAASAQTLAYLMLRGAWPAQRVREKLALFQTGVSSDGEKTPYFVAAEVIKGARKKSEARDRLSTIKELGVTMHVMIAAEKNIKAIGAGSLKAAVKKEVPSPVYPEDELKQAA